MNSEKPSRKRRTHKEFVDDIFTILGKEYEILSPFEGVKKNVTVRHSCGHEYSVTAGNLLAGYRCMKCFGNEKKDMKSFILEISKIRDDIDDYDFSKAKYISHNSGIQNLIHKPCGKTVEISPANMKKGNQCIHCNNKVKKTNEEYKEYVESIGYVGEYSLIGKYINGKIPTDIRHNKCNNVFSPIPINFIHKESRCPYCSNYKTENEIYEYIVSILDMTSYSVIRQYKSSLLEPNTRYKFDYCILNVKTQSIECVIEYDGEFHYLPIISEEILETQQKRDSLKNEICKNHKINLLRIPYTEKKNYSQILKLFFDKHNIINSTPR